MQDTSGKGSNKDQLAALKKMGAPIDESKFKTGAPIPTESLYILDYYYRIRRATALTYQEVYCFSELSNTCLAGFEVEAIMNIDSIFEEVNRNG